VPYVMVKGQSATGTISGTILCGSGCGSVGLSFGQAINVAGNVYAEMSEELDPNTGYALTMCPGGPPDQASTMPGCMNAKTSFSANVNGQYELGGLAPGIYTLYVSADGFPEIVFASGVTVNPGQTLSINAYVCSSSGFVNGNCSQTPTPTPEFPSGSSIIVTTGIILALAAITLRKRKNPGVDLNSLNKSLTNVQINPEWTIGDLTLSRQRNSRVTKP
ncbi:MAG TPA: carboxypeptidase-like regulatory domain-containing protein, partial [Candidatus Acidoferrum sp.]|nr:carboxypeptidase-like regulatory domain-containing protein [Candidatus Acidoferrum sp.]